MPRKPRCETETGAWHVYARGNNRQPIFLGDDDRLDYIDRLAKTVVRRRWHCMAYCLMKNHVHLLIETTEPNLGRGIGYLHGQYAQQFHRRHAPRGGHLFGERFGAVRIKDDEQLWTAAAYVARNPVEAGLVGRAEQWRWGSHAAVVAGAAPEWLAVERLAGYFGGLGSYLDHVARAPVG